MVAAAYIPLQRQPPLVTDHRGGDQVTVDAGGVECSSIGLVCPGA